MARDTIRPRDGGGLLRRARRTAGLTITALAEKAGLSRPHLSNLERGARAASPETARALARVLDAKPGELFDL